MNINAAAIVLTTLFFTAASESSVTWEGKVGMSFGETCTKAKDAAVPYHLLKVVATSTSSCTTVLDIKPGKIKAYWKSILDCKGATSTYTLYTCTSEDCAATSCTKHTAGWVDRPADPAIVNKITKDEPCAFRGIGEEDDYAYYTDLTTTSGNFWSGIKVCQDRSLNPAPAPSAGSAPSSSGNVKSDAGKVLPAAGYALLMLLAAGSTALLVKF